ncbi:MAG: hypothetical protein Q9164_000558 [Protoblastenia rupestris]
MAPYVWQGPLKKTGVIDVFKQKLLAPSLGSEFSDLDLVEALKSPNADALFRDLAVTISERGVAVFRNQHLDNETHQQVVNRIAIASGRPAENDIMTNALYPLYGDDPKVITLIPERVAERYGYKTESQKRQSSSHEWHSDMSFEENPSDYSSLRLGQVPETGGDTLYASAYDLYDRMSEPFQKLFENLTVQWGDPHYTEACGTEGTYKGPRGSPANVGFGFDAAHPAVRTNPVTGWNAIFAGGMHCRGFKGVTTEESNRLMAMIEDLITKNHDIQARVRWEAPGDIAIWDNRAVKHIPTRDVQGKGKRKGYRVLSAGEKPFLAPDATGRQAWKDSQKDGGQAGRVQQKKMETGQKMVASPLEGLNGNVNGVVAAH